MSAISACSSKNTESFYNSKLNSETPKMREVKYKPQNTPKMKEVYYKK